MPEPMQQSDHDVLITLVETVKNQHTALLGKIEDVRNNVRQIRDVELRELKDGIHVKVADHEARIRTIEAEHERVNPEKAVELLQIHDKWITEFKITWKTILVIVGAGSSAVTFILSFVIQLSKILGGNP